MLKGFAAQVTDGHIGFDDGEVAGCVDVEDIGEGRCVDGGLGVGRGPGAVGGGVVDTKGVRGGVEGLDVFGEFADVETVSLHEEELGVNWWRR